MKSILIIILSFLLVVSGFCQTRNVVVDTNGVVVQPTNIWTANATNARSGLGLGSAATNPASAFQPSSAVLSNLASSNGSYLTNLTLSNVVGLQTALNGKIATNGNGFGLTNLNASNITGLIPASNISTINFSNVNGTLSVSSGGTGATNSGAARTNLGLPWSGLTNTNSSSFQSALFGSNTNPVFVDTNGTVVSPTNFWQVAPIQKVVQTFTPVTNSTNAGTNARNLYIYSLATNITGVTNVVTLPTNAATFVGDNATIVHRGTTNSVTAIRQYGASTNLIVISNYDDAIKFIHENGTWDFYHNISFVEPIKLSGTNASVNAAASRTNLGLGWPALTNTNAATSLLGFTTNGQVVANTGTNVLTFTNTISIQGGPRITEAGVYYGPDNTQFGLNLEEAKIVSVSNNAIVDFGDGNNILANWPITFNTTTNAAATRTNLGLPLAALTNTNNANFQEAIFTTNAAPTNAGNFGDHVAWMGVSIVTNGVTNVFKIPLYK